MTDFEKLVEGLQRDTQKNSGLNSVVCDFGIDAETRRFWKANGGNAKARRRWRRRDIPNSQKAEANAETTPVNGGTWPDKATWAPGIWAGTVSVAAGVVTGEPAMRVAKVDREARRITMEALP